MQTITIVAEKYNINSNTLKRRLEKSGFPRPGKGLPWILTDEMIRQCITEYKGKVGRPK